MTIEIIKIFYFIFPIIVGFFKAKSIWKGICGGNGIPQTDELAKALSLMSFWIECGLYMFFDSELNISYLILLLGVLGISSIGSKFDTIKRN